MIKDNFELIARNLTLIHDFLQQNEPYNKMEEVARLALTGVLDALVYLQRGEIRFRHIDDCVNGASFGRCIVGMLSPQIRNPFDNPLPTEDDRFVDFAVNLEALLMTVDNRQIDPKEVIMAVISKRDAISKTIRDTRSLIKSKGYPQDVVSLVEEYNSSPEYSQAREWVGSYGKSS